MENKESHAYSIQKLVFEIFGNDCIILKNTFNNDPTWAESFKGEIQIKLNKNISDHLNLKDILKLVNVFTISYDKAINILSIKV